MPTIICKLCGRTYKDTRNRTRCNSCNTKIRRIRAKLAAIKYLGGKCIKCGWNGNAAAFEFHHRASSDKEFNLGGVANRSWDVIKCELDKCDLLCSNCHRMLHSNRDEARWVKEASTYKGRLLS